MENIHPWRYLVLKAKPKNSHCPQSTCFSSGHPAEKNAWGTAYGQHAVFPLIWQGDTMAQILAKSEFSPRRQLETTAKVDSGLEQGLMVPSEPSLLPHSSGSSLQRPTYWQTTHTQTHTRPRDNHCWPWTWDLRRMEGGKVMTVLPSE